MSSACQNDHLNESKISETIKTKSVCVPTPVLMHPVKNGLHRMQDRIQVMWSCTT